MSEEELRTKVFEALGEASTCWEHMEDTGVFDAERAKAVGERLMDDIKRYAEEPS